MNLSVIRSIRQMGVISFVQYWRARRFVLPRIERFAGISVPASGSMEVHMLLHRGRLLEGMWAIRSFLTAAGTCGPVVIHDDGSLGTDGADRLQRQFPGIQVIHRAESDAELGSVFRGGGWQRCAEFRAKSVFGLKLFDVCALSRSRDIVLLDSDVLFFRKPVELLDGNWGGDHVYQRDFARSYCLSEASMTRFEGPNPAPQLNPGIMRFRRESVDFQRIENYLSDDSFYDPGGKPSYFAELTIWALEASQSSNGELPGTYGMNTSPWIYPTAVAGHFCGGGYWASTFYSRGITELNRRICEKG